jgi:hypothetical protein
MRVPGRLARWIGLGLICGGIIGSAVILTRRTQLLSCATMILKTIPDLYYYHWLSSHELLIIRGQLTASDEVNWQFARWNLDTNRETPLPDLSRRLPRHVDAPNYLCVSPDGHWMLWREADRIGAAALDGSMFRSWMDASQGSRPGFEELYWQGDSRHFVQLTSTPDWRRVQGAIIRNVMEPETAEQVGIRPVAELAATAYYAPASVTPHGELFAWAPQDEDTSRKTLVYVPLTAGGKLRKCELKAPLGLQFDHARATPHTTMALFNDGRRIAWFCHTAPYIPRLTELMAHFVPRLRTHLLTHEELCVADVTGGRVRTVGGIDLNVEQYEAPSALQWLPDGKQVSFEFHGALYTMSVD